MSLFLTYIASSLIRTGLVSLAPLALGQQGTDSSSTHPSSRVHLVLSSLSLALGSLGWCNCLGGCGKTLWTWELRQDMKAHKDYWCGKMALKPMGVLGVSRMKCCFYEVTLRNLICIQIMSAPLKRICDFSMWWVYMWGRGNGQWGKGRNIQ